MKKIIVLFTPIGLILFLLFIIMLSLAGSTTNANIGSCDSGDSTSITGMDFNQKVLTKIIEKQGNVYKDKSDKIIKESKKAGVSPLLFASIMANESAWGTSAAIRDHNNPSGQMIGLHIIDYPTLDKGIEATGETLHRLVIEQHLDTVEKLGEHYCPVGAANDPTGLNKNWVPGVKKIMKLLNGDKDTGDNIATGGEGCSLNDITVTGDKVSYFDDVFKIAKSKLGTPYVLGANGPDSFDCSGFVIYCLSHANVSINFGRTAQSQYNGTKRITQKQSKAGDLVFFEHTYDTGRGDRITHVAFYMGGDKFIGAQGSDVNVDNFKSGYWKEHLAGFGRVK